MRSFNHLSSTHNENILSCTTAQGSICYDTEGEQASMPTYAKYCEVSSSVVQSAIHIRGNESAYLIVFSISFRSTERGKKGFRCKRRKKEFFFTFTFRARNILNILILNSEKKRSLN